MKRLLYALLLAGVATGCAAHGLGNLADVRIIDRDTGTELTPHYFHGEYWVAGRPGARYAIEIRNALGERILAVSSVDGVNVVSGATAGWNQTGYVFEPGQRFQILGWRKSDTEVAAFTFTASTDSYAERTGRPANVGVIGVALFRERPSAVAVVPDVAAPATGRDDAARERREAPSDRARAGGLAASPASPAASLALPAPLARLGTGHGERETSYVGHTVFVRERDEPDEVVRIRYDSLERLVAMGIVRRQPPRPLPRGANPFPATPLEGYVPDPPG